MARFALAVLALAAALHSCAAASNPNFYFPAVTGLNTTTVRAAARYGCFVCMCCWCAASSVPHWVSLAHARFRFLCFVTLLSKALEYVKNYHVIMEHIMEVAKGDSSLCPQAEKLLYETGIMMQVRSFHHGDPLVQRA